MRFFLSKTDPCEKLIPYLAVHSPLEDVSDPEEDLVFAGQCTERLDALAEKLVSIATSTDDEFLEIGERLAHFHKCAREAVQMSADVVDQVAGEKMKKAITNLEEIVSNIERYLTKTEDEAAHCSKTLGTISNLLDDMTEPLVGFRKMNKVLRMFGTSTKIESARIGENASGFNTLAEEVNLLAERVQDKSITIHAQKKDLGVIVQQTRSMVSAMEAEQRNHVRTILDKTKLSLSAIIEINTMCADSAVALSSFSEEISRNIGGVVISLQFNDIVRQQLEHVQEALVSLVERLRNQSNASICNDLVSDIGDICELQAAQLNHAVNELVAAVESIIGNLGEIAGKEQRMSTETRKMAGIADRTDVSFFEEMEKGFAVVQKSLAMSIASNSTLSTAITNVAGTVGDIAKFINDIDEVWEEIELISINAQIKSARIGTGGAALGVIAEAIQRLSVDTNIRTISVSKTLTAIDEAAASQWLKVTGDIHQMEEDVGDLMNKLNSILDFMRRVSENLLSSLSMLDREVQALCAEIEYVTSGITAHTRVADLLGEDIKDLNRIVDVARSIVPAKVAVEGAKSLKEEASRYTMSSERFVHESLMGGVTGELASAGVLGMENLEATDSELGDNVELF